jgi:hypothetical protein
MRAIDWRYVFRTTCFVLAILLSLCVVLMWIVFNGGNVGV